MKDMLYLNGDCEILGKIINIRQLWILIHFCTKFPSAWKKEIDFRTWVLFWFFSFFWHSLNHHWSDSICFSSLGPVLFLQGTKSENKYQIVICKICDILHYSRKRKRTRNFVINCDWKKCFSIRKFELKFTLMAFTQEMERGINFGLLKRVNRTCSMNFK